MKYYIYVSDAKVEMLFSQIPRGLLQKIEAEIQVNLGIINLDVRQKESQQNRYDKLKVVAHYLDQNMHVGTVDDPGEYFRATLPMRWGPYGDSETKDFVYFGGRTERTILGLGGSAHHLIGVENGNSVPFFSGSLTYSIFDILRKEFGVAALNDSMTRVMSRGDREREFALMAVQYATLRTKGTEQKLEFLAKKLVEGPLEDFGTHRSSHILLGTPIYVASVD